MVYIDWCIKRLQRLHIKKALTSNYVKLVEIHGVNIYHYFTDFIVSLAAVLSRGEESCVTRHRTAAKETTDYEVNNYFSF